MSGPGGRWPLTSPADRPGTDSPSALTRNQPAKPLTLNWNCRDNTFLLVKPPSPWHFVTQPKQWKAQRSSRELHVATGTLVDNVSLCCAENILLFKSPKQ